MQPDNAIKTPAYLEAVVFVYEIMTHPMIERIQLRSKNGALRPHLSDATAHVSAKTTATTYGGAHYVGRA